MDSPTRNTVRLLERCREARAAGYPVYLTTDPAWLVNMAINRRAGWPDDPAPWRGSAMPVDGRYPPKASGDTWNHLRLIAGEVNTPRLSVRPGRLGEWREYLMAKLPERFHTDEGES